jgi:predicted TPR repeat methyltransferase
LGDVSALSEKLAALRDSIQADPEFIYWDAVLDVREKRPNAAIEKLQRCLELAPGAPAPAFTLGRLMFQSGALERAAELFESSLQAAPEHLPAWLALAETRLRLGHASRAERAFSAALELGATGATPLIGLAQSLEAQARWQDAVQLLMPQQHDSAVESQLIRMMVQHATPDATKAYLQDILQRNPTHVQATHLLGGLEPSAQSARASDAYVRELFDGYASRYDAHMRTQMGYVVPQLLAQRILELQSAPADALDLGCGTGLLGPELPGFRLTGVDLSQPMLDLAHERNYVRLVANDIDSFLASVGDAEFDLITAADTLIYFGALREVFAQCARVLRPSGWLIFNVEKPAQESGLGYEQTPVGRYGHEVNYLRQLAAEFGYVQIETRAIMPRREAGVAMQGTIFSARRPG